jgi:hypothetical protein
MSKIVATIYTTAFLGDKEKAKRFFCTLDKINFIPEKIGLFEPLKTEYSLEKAIEMWTLEEDGCYVEGLGNTGKSGGMIGKVKDPNFRFDIHWWKSPKKVYLNTIDFYLPLKTYKKYKESVEYLFKETIEISDAVYAYMTHIDAERRQHVTGTLETRLPGIFYCNYFGTPYVEFFGEEKILSYPWVKINQNLEGGILTYLAEYPDKEILKTEELEISAKTHIGKDSFGDIKRFLDNPNEIQIRNVPTLISC